MNPSPSSAIPAPEWTPRFYGLNGSSRETVVSDLLDAAGALARAEECVRRTYPHGRDGDCEERKPPYIETLQMFEDLFERIQEEARRAMAAPPAN